MAKELATKSIKIRASVHKDIVALAEEMSMPLNAVMAMAIDALKRGRR